VTTNSFGSFFKFQLPEWANWQFHISSRDRTVKRGEHPFWDTVNFENSELALGLRIQTPQI
jgi:hypothetical protein